jgi:hypothetical protein
LYEGAEWIYLAKHKDSLWAFLNVVMNFSFWKRIFFHGFTMLGILLLYILGHTNLFCVTLVTLSIYQKSGESGGNIDLFSLDHWFSNVLLPWNSWAIKYFYRTLKTGT